jgi:hypothetical protein
VKALSRALSTDARFIVAAATRHRVAVGVVYVVLVALQIALAIAPPELAPSDVMNVVHGYRALSPLGVVGAFALATPVHVLFARTRSSGFARILAAVPLVFTAEKCVVAFAGDHFDDRRALSAAACAAAAAAAIAFVVRVPRGSPRRIKETLVAAQLSFAFALAPVLVGRALASESGSTSLVVRTAALGLMGATVSLGALTWFVWRAPIAAASPILARPKKVGFKAQIAAARTFTLVLLIPVYLGFDLAKYVRTGAQVEDTAHKMLMRGEAMMALKKQLDEKPIGPERTELPLSTLLVGLGPLTAPTVCEAGHCRMQIHFSTPEESLDDVFELDVKDLDTKIAKSRLAMTSDATYIGAREPKDATHRELYLAIQDRLQSRTVHVPLVDLQLGPDRARWALGAIAIAILVLVRNRLGTALRDGGASDDEPWLLLDTGDPFERIVSTLYFAVVVAASELIACALAMAAWPDPSPRTLALLFLQWSLGATLSWSVAVRALKLRARRAAGPPPPPAPPPLVT